MRSWILLLLAALLTTRLRLGNAEGDPLPSSLLDLLQDSPISSVEDLKLLLQHESNAKEDEEDEHDVLPNPAHRRYARSLMEAQQAQPAECKVRTEVMEVTRSMHDRHNANFMLWPSCVEVQRCSGCCSSRLLNCVPLMTSSRYLKVLKIMYIERKAKYEPVIISVEDHVKCVCQSSSQKPPPSSYVPAAPTWPVRPTLPRTHSSKADLHRHDNLKHNQQRHHPQEHEARQWQQGSYTQLLRWTQPRVHQTTAHVQTGTHQIVTGMSGSVSSWPSEARAEHVMGSVQQAGQGSGFDRSREETGGEEVHRPDHEQRQQQLLQHQQRLQHQYHQQPQHPQQDNYKGEEEQELRTSQHWLKAPQSDSASPPVSLTQSPKVEGNPTPFPSITQKDSVTSQQFTEVTKDKQTETGKVGQKGGNEKKESGLPISGEPAGAEPTNQGRKRDSIVSRENGSLTEEERRQKLLEIVQTEPEETSLLHQHRHHHHHNHHQQRPKPTYKTAISTIAPRSAAAHQKPLRPPRRKRKHRKRMSKAAMRAKILKEMV